MRICKINLKAVSECDCEHCEDRNMFEGECVHTCESYNEKKEGVTPICMTKEYWMASQLSVAKYTGGCKAWNHEYLVMPQSLDLLRLDFIPVYKKVGRDKFLEVLKTNPQATDKELKVIFKEMTAKKKGNKEEQNLFNV